MTDNFDEFNASVEKAPSVDFDKFNQEVEPQIYDRPIEAFAQGAARGLSFGLSDVAETALGIRSKEELKKLEEHNPVASTAGEFTGVAAPLVLSGGTSLLAQGAEKLGAGVLGVSKLGSAAEQFALKNLLKETGGSATKQILQKAAAKGLGSAVEGAFYGAGQVVSEAALGDPAEVAQNAVGTIGLSSLLAGSLVGGGSILGPALKDAIKSAIPKGEGLFSKLTGISKEATTVLKERPGELDTLLSKADDASEALNAHALDSAPEAKAKIRNVFDNLSNDFDKKLSEVDHLSAPLNFKPKDGKSILDIFDQARRKLTPEGLEPLPEARGYLNQIDEIENTVMRTARRNAGLPLDGIISKPEMDKMYLTARQWNALRKQFQDAGEFAKEIGKLTPIESLYNQLQYSANKAIEEAITPELRPINKQISQLIEYQSDLKKYGFTDRVIDPQKYKKLYLAKNQNEVSAFKDILQSVDAEHGTDLWKDVELGRAFNNLYQQNAIAKSFTGRSLLAPGLGAAVGSVAGVFGAAGGAVAGELLQSPVIQRNLAKGLVRLGDMVSSEEASQLGEAVNRLVPANAVPWVSAQIAGLATLERANKRMDSKINDAVNSLASGDYSDVDHDSLRTLSETSYGKNYSRREEDPTKAFKKRREELLDLATNPQKLTDHIAENLKEISMVAPQVSNAMSSLIANAAQFLAEKAPKNPFEDAPFKWMKESWQPSDSELSEFQRYVTAVENPASVFKDIKSGVLSPEGIEVLQELYPSIYSKLQKKIIDKLSSKKSLPYEQKVLIGTVFQSAMDEDQKPEVLRLLQSNYANDLTHEPTKPIKLNGNQPTQIERITAR
jgi:hypothetical protein